MRVIPALAQPWAGSGDSTGRERYVAPVNGKRVLGWADTNISLLASDLGVSYTYLLGVLKGSRNCTLNLLHRAAFALGLSPTELITKMEHSYHLNAQAAQEPSPASRRRQQQRERRQQRMPK